MLFCVFLVSVHAKQQASGGLAAEDKGLMLLVSSLVEAWKNFMAA
jgi:hypothetical protein